MGHLRAEMMMMRTYFWGFFACCGLVLCGCHDKPATGSAEPTHFTKMDSVTETYLHIKDAMLESWNRMIGNDNQRIKAMQNLVHELQVANPPLRDELAVYDDRIKQLKDMRYTQASMENINVVEEYDFASNALVTDLISLAEAQPEFDYNSTLQKIIQKIRTADQRVMTYRHAYDSVAVHYNRFVEEHKALIKEVESDSVVRKKPLFHMASD